MKIQKNLGTIDRMARIVAGVILLLLVPLAYVGPGSGWAFLGLLGLFPLVAGIVGYCPPYALLGINTYREGKKQNDNPQTACC
jgi:hypothetical protein